MGGPDGHLFSSGKIIKKCVVIKLCVVVIKFMCGGIKLEVVDDKNECGMINYGGK